MMPACGCRKNWIVPARQACVDTVQTTEIHHGSGFISYAWSAKTIPGTFSHPAAITLHRTRCRVPRHR